MSTQQTIVLSLLFIAALLHFAFSFLLPEIFLWNLHLIEYHPRSQEYSFAEGQYYFDYTQKPFATKQFNQIFPSMWRPSVNIPLTVFVAVDGKMGAAYLNGTSGHMTCGHLNATYDDEYWPRNFLKSKCEYLGEKQLPVVFNGTFHDGTIGDGYSCKMGIQLIAYTTKSKDMQPQVLRIEVPEQLPLWNYQVWDIVSTVEIDQLPGYFWQIPSWLNC